MTKTSKPHKVWTYEEYFQLDDGKRYEIINGELIDVTPGRPPIHQKVSGNLLMTIMEYLNQHNNGRLLPGPIDVKFDETNVVQPDLLVVTNENEDILKERAIDGPPDIMIEIISPTSIVYDRKTKFELYLKFGVPEYWIVDPAYPSIEVYQLQDGKYEDVSFAAKTGEVESSIFKGLKVHVEDITQ